MRVLFGPEVFGQRYGGISRYFVELQRRLPGLGVASQVLAGGHRNTYLSEVRGVRGIHVPQRLQKARARPTEERLNAAVVRAWLRLSPPSTIYHQTYYHGAAGGTGRGPVVVTAYDLIHAKFADQFPADDPTVAQQRAAFDRADLILAISHNTAADLQEVFGIPAAKICVTHLGVTPAVDDAGSSGRARPFLLYVGLRYGYKNWERFVRAVASREELAGHDVVCVGAGAFTADEARLLEALGLTGRTHQVTADDRLLAAHYADADAFVYPSLYEGFGLPPLEAMTRGCPVVAAAAGSVPEVLGDAAELVDPTDVEAIAEGIVRALQPDRREQLVTRGRERAATFTWDATAAETVRAYRQVLG